MERKKRREEKRERERESEPPEIPIRINFEPYRRRAIIKALEKKLPSAWGPNHWLLMQPRFYLATTSTLFLNFSKQFIAFFCVLGITSPPLLLPEYCNHIPLHLWNACMQKRLGIIIRPKKGNWLRRKPSKKRARTHTRHKERKGFLLSEWPRAYHEILPPLKFPCGRRRGKKNFLVQNAGSERASRRRRFFLLLFSFL